MKELGFTIIIATIVNAFMYLLFFTGSKVWEWITGEDLNIFAGMIGLSVGMILLGVGLIIFG